jgi:hypothetical protein
MNSSELEFPQLDAEVSTTASDSLLSKEEPVDEDAAFEFATFTPDEREVFFGCRAALIEHGSNARRADRDAAAAILEHRRLHQPTLNDRELQQAERFFEVLKETMEEGDAEREAVARVMANRKSRGRQQKR